jgi:hypothetical protein
LNTCTEGQKKGSLSCAKADLPAPPRARRAELRSPTETCTEVTETQRHTKKRRELCAMDRGGSERQQKQIPRRRARRFAGYEALLGMTAVRFRGWYEQLRRDPSAQKPRLRMTTFQDESRLEAGATKIGAPLQFANDADALEPLRHGEFASRTRLRTLCRCSLC